MKEQVQELIEPQAYLSFLLGIFCLLISILPIVTISGLASSIPLLKLSILLIIIAIPLAIFFGITAKSIIRKSKRELGGKHLANFGITSALLTAFYLILILVAIPSNSNIYYMMQANKCENDIQTIAEGVKQYIASTQNYPVNLKQITEKGFLKEIPQCLAGDYTYTIERTPLGDPFFVIEFPYPDKLLKGSGLKKPLKYRRLAYVQGEGLVIRTVAK